MEITLNVNSINYKAAIHPNDMLLDVLRKLGFKSVKRGCDTGSCGVCNVLVDEKLMASCSFFAYKAIGKKIKTIEGIQDEAKEIGKYLVAEGVDQCGYCSPGLVMAIYSMRNEITGITFDEIKHYLAGNLCRCSGYEGQHRAIKKYLEVKAHE